MSSTTALAITATLSSGGFALAGVVLSNHMATRRERAKFHTETALEIAEVERLVWGNDWTELNVQLQRQEARLTVAGVADDLVKAFSDISLACWRDRTPYLDDGSGEEDVGISAELLDARRQVHRAIGAYLLRKESRSGREQLRRQVVETSRRVIDEEERARRGLL